MLAFTLGSCVFESPFQHVGTIVRYIMDLSDKYASHGIGLPVTLIIRPSVLSIQRTMDVVHIWSAEHYVTVLVLVWP